MKRTSLTQICFVNKKACVATSQLLLASSPAPAPAPPPSPSPSPVGEDVDAEAAAPSTTTLNDDVNHGEHFLIAGPCKLC